MAKTTPFHTRTVWTALFFSNKNR